MAYEPFPWSTEQSIADAWRGTLAEVDECIGWIREHRLSLDRGTNIREYVEKRLAERLRMYKNAIRRVSDYEEWMVKHHVMFDRDLKSQERR